MEVGQCVKRTGANWRLALVLALSERAREAGEERRREEEDRFVALERKICGQWVRCPLASHALLVPGHVSR